MKILLAGFAKVKYMPYLQFYLENIDRTKHEMHLIYWNRDLTDENLSSLDGITLHEFRCFQEDNVSSASKIGNFLKYRKYVKGILKQSDFDFAILLHSFPAVLLSDIWTKRYKNSPRPGSGTKAKPPRYHPDFCREDACADTSRLY